MRAAAILLLAASPAFAQAPKNPEGWAQHDLDRPQPAVVDPGTGVPPETPGKPPSDAVVLFDGRDLSAWKSRKDGAAAAWKVENGYFEVVPKTGDIETKQSFGDAQLHIEWMAPDPAKGESQDRGNSGVFFGGGRYEIQVLDSYVNKTYPDGQAGALYGEYPPLVNACRRPGQWQAYDIVYEAPRFDGTGNLLKAARVTVFHNGVLVQHAMELIGPTTNKVRTPYSAHPEKLPISLQDHNHPVRFRNVWVRELLPRQPKP
ncbi:MAG TPA: DUF1080 domain-containing protein [Vicinamibacteria bacterium]|nr:DUF1080 domain-containing protein [Vicinamibacteria bacterium]